MNKSRYQREAELRALKALYSGPLRLGRVGDKVPRIPMTHLKSA